MERTKISPMQRRNSVYNPNTSDKKGVNRGCCRIGVALQAKEIRSKLLQALTRYARLILLTAITSGFIAIAISLSQNYCGVTEGQIKIDPQRLLNLTLAGCKLTVRATTSKEWHYSIQTYKPKSFPPIITNSKIDAFSFGDQYFCRCKVFLDIPLFSGVAPSLTIETKKKGSTTNEIYIMGTKATSQNGLVFREIDFTGPQGVVYMENVFVQDRLNLKFTEGAITTIGVRIPSEDGLSTNKNYIGIDDGDVFLDAANSGLSVTYTTPAAGTCFHASKIAQRALNNGNITETGNIVETLLCSDHNCSEAAQRGNGSVTVDVKRGAFYAILKGSRISMSTNNNLSTSFNSVSTINDTWLSPDDEWAVATLSQFRSSSPNTDIYALVNLERSIGSPPHMVFTSNQIYLQIAPWVLSSLSFSLVKPQLYNIQIRNIPRCSIFYGGDTTYVSKRAKSVRHLGQISRYVDKLLKEEPTDAVGGRLVRKVDKFYFQFLKEFLGRKIWFNDDIDIVTTTYSMGNDRIYRELVVHNFGNIKLLVAVSISLVLALMFGIGLVLLMIKFVSNTIQGHFNEYDRWGSYMKLRDTFNKPEYGELAFKEKEKKRIEEQAGSAKAKKPPRRMFLFTLPEIFLSTLRESTMDSLKAFLESITVPIQTVKQNKTEKVEMSLVLPQYEMFCFKNRYIPKDILQERALCKKKGLSIKIEHDGSTDCFCGIRLANNFEKAQRSSYKLMPNEDSLTYFVRKECVVTPFKDSISSRQFNRTYLKFCLKHSGAPVPVTKRAMEKLGVKFKRLHITYLECHPFRENGTIHKIDFSLHREHWKEKNKKSVSVAMNIFSVMINFAFACCVPMPIVGICFLSELAVDSISPLDHERRLSTVSVNAFVSTFHNMQWATFTLLLLSFGITMLAMIELVCHYATNNGTLEEQSEKKMGTLRSLLHTSISILFVVYFTFIFSYIGLALIWLIFSAVLNPDVFLPYAVGAATIITYVYRKGAVYYSLYRNAFNIIRALLGLKIEQRFQQIAVKFQKLPSIKSLSVNEDLSRVVAVVETDTQLSDTLKRIGIQAEQIIQLAQLCDDVLLSTAERLGMDCEVLKLVVASSRPNTDIVLLLQDLCKNSPGISMDSNTAAILYKLSKINTEESLHLAIKQAVIHYGTVNKNEKVKPHLIDAIVAMTRGSVSRLVDVITMQPELSKQFEKAQYFFELVRTRDVSIMEFEFAKDLERIGVKLCELDEVLMKALSAVSMHTIPPVNAGEHDAKQEPIKHLAEILNVKSFLIRLVVAVATREGNAIRVQGPGTDVFEKFIEAKYSPLTLPNVDIKSIQNKLRILSACAWGTSVSIEQLASTFAIDHRKSVAMAHLMSHECGEGNFRLGLPVEKKMMHLSPIAEKLNLEHTESLIGIFKILCGPCATIQKQEKPNKSKRNCKKHTIEIEHPYIRCFVQEIAQKLNLKDKSENIIYNFFAVQVSKDEKRVENYARALQGLTENYKEAAENQDDRADDQVSISILQGEAATEVDNSRKASERQFKQRAASTMKLQRDDPSSLMKIILKHATDAKMHREAQRGFTATCRLIYAIYDLEKNTTISKALETREMRDLIDDVSSVLEIDEDVFKCFMGIALSNTIIMKNRNEENQIVFNETKQIKLNYVLKLLGEKLEDDFHIACHTYMQGEEHARRMVEEVEKIPSRSHKTMVPKFVFEFLIYHTKASTVEQERRKLLENVIEYKQYQDTVSDSDNESADPVKDLCKGLMNIEYTDGDFIRAFEKAWTVPKQDHPPRHLSMALDLFGNCSDRATVTGTANFMAEFMEDHNHEQSHGCSKLVCSGITLVFHPFSEKVILWNLFVGVCTIYSIISTSIFIVTQNIDEDMSVLYFDAAVDGVFLVDIIISFLTTYMKPDGDFEESHSKIALHYFKGNFFLDLIASIPFSLIYFFVKNVVWRANKFFRFARLPRLLRLYRTYLQLKQGAANLKQVELVESDTPDFKNNHVAASFVAFASKFTGQLEIADDSDEIFCAKNKWTASGVLSARMNIPKLFLDLVLNVALNNQDEVKENLIALVGQKKLRKTPDENIARGFISLATGKVDCIEDVAETVNFDANIAEGLAFIASSVTLNQTFDQFMSSSALNKLCNQCGLPHDSMSALLAIVNQDYMHGSDIDDAISLVKIDGRYLRSILAIYSPEYPDKGKKEKRSAIRSSIQPLAVLYKTNEAVATAIIRLVQGDVAVVRGILQIRLGYVKDEGDKHCAFALLAQAMRIPLDFSPCKHEDWDDTRDAGKACELAAKEMSGLEEEDIYFLLCAVLEDKGTQLQDIAKKLEKGYPTHQILLKMGDKEENIEENNMIKAIIASLPSKKRKKKTDCGESTLKKEILSVLRLLIRGEYSIDSKSKDGYQIICRKLIIAISTGSAETVKKVLSECKKLEELKTILARLSLVSDPNIGLEFFVRVASKEKEAWEIKDGEGDGVISSKIHPVTDLVIAIAALAANDVATVQFTSNVLCSSLSLDKQLALAILNIAMGQESKMHNSAAIISSRVHVNPKICLGFLCGASLTQANVEDWIQPICKELGLEPKLVSSILLCAQCKGRVSLQACCTIYEYLVTVKKKKKCPLCDVVDKMHAIHHDTLGTISSNDMYDKLAKFYKETYVNEQPRGGLDCDLLDSDQIRLHFETNHMYGEFFVALVSKDDDTVAKCLKYNLIEKKLFPEKIKVKTIKGGEKFYLCQFLMAVAHDDEKYIDHYFQLLELKDDKEKDFIKRMLAMFNKNAKDEDIEYIEKSLSERSDFKVGKEFGFLSLYYYILTNNVAKLKDWAKKLQKQEKWATTMPYLKYIELLVDLNMKNDKNIENDKKHFEKLGEYLGIASNASNASRDLEKLIHYTLCSDIDQVCKLTGEEKLMKEIAYLANRKHPCFKEYELDRNKDFEFEELPRRCKSNSNSKSFRALLDLLAGGRTNFGKGGAGIGTAANDLAKDYLNDSEKLELNGLYLSDVDAPSNIDKIKETAKTLAEKMMPGAKAADLISSIIDLCSPRSSPKEADEAYLNAMEGLQKAYSSDTASFPSSEAIAVCGLARSDMSAFGLMGRELGEYDSVLMQDLARLLLRVVPVLSNNGEVNDLEESLSDELVERHEANENAESIRDRQLFLVFSMFDESKLGYLNVYEFKTVMKCYGIELTEEKALELFSIGDPEGSGLLGVYGLQTIMLNMETKLAFLLLGQLKKSAMRLVGIFAAGLLVLLFMLMFVYLGIESFGKPSPFNSVINSILPMALGAGVGSSDATDEGAENGERGDNEDGDDGTGVSDDELKKACEQVIDMLDMSKFKSV